MPERHYDLGTAELEVLKVLWEHGRCTVRQVLACLHEAGRHVKYTTALTFLTRLEQKGYRQPTLISSPREAKAANTMMESESTALPSKNPSHEAA